MFQCNSSFDENFLSRGEAGERTLSRKRVKPKRERVRRACFSAHASQSDTGPEWWAQILEAEYPTAAAAAAAERYYEYCVPGLIVFRYKSIGARSRAASSERRAREIIIVMRMACLAGTKRLLLSKWAAKRPCNGPCHTTRHYSKSGRDQNALIPPGPQPRARTKTPTCLLITKIYEGKDGRAFGENGSMCARPLLFSASGCRGGKLISEQRK